jgi:hypothetical protein
MPGGGADPNRGLRIVAVPGKGRGIVAGRRFSHGEVVDSDPVVVIPATQWKTVEDTVLGRFSFIWDETKGSAAVALGRGSLFNHSYSPNVASDKQVRKRLIVFTALRDIEVGEEMTLNYNGDPRSREPMWFDVRDP